MRHKIGLACMMLGILMLVSALTLFFYNRREAAKAERAADALMPMIMEQIQQQEHEVEPEHPTLSLDLPQIPDAENPADLVMTEVEIDGHAYIGYLTIPALGMELPIMADWDYPRLRIAPCRYAGTVKGDNLVLMAHNYNRHFGRIDTLVPGDSVLFTDMDGITTVYEVVASDVLDPYAIEEMTAGAFDLTLFTCTYGGKSRVTVYCDRTTE